MLSISERFKELGWTEYETQAYVALVEGGAAKAVDLAARSGIPQGRIYQVISLLERKGAVRRTGQNPATFFAQNPREVVGTTLERMQEQMATALEQAEQAWEVARDVHVADRMKAWTAVGAYAGQLELRELASGAKRQLVLVADDLRWLPPRDMTWAAGLIQRGVRMSVLGGQGSSAHLERLARAGAEAHVLPAAIPLSFVVADEERVLIQLTQPDTWVYLASKETCELFLQRYHELRADARPVDVKALAPN